MSHAQCPTSLFLRILKHKLKKRSKNGINTSKYADSAQHLRAWIAKRTDGAKLYYWRTKSGSEVDFVVYGPDIFSAWEVRYATRVNNNDLRALKAFRDDYPEASVALLYMGQDRLVVDGIPVIPIIEFLTAAK